MSTRAVYTFIDSHATFHVYKHHDGYPSGAAEAITNALPLAWDLPRFEADEFACAFIAGNKPVARDIGPIHLSAGGGLRLTNGPECHGDLEYRYEISQKKGYEASLWIRAYDIGFNADGPAPETLIFEGRLHDMKNWIAKQKTE